MTVENTPTPDTKAEAPKTKTEYSLDYVVDPVISNLEHDVKPIVYRTKEINGIPVQLIDKRRSARKPVMEEVLDGDSPIKITDRRVVRGAEGLKEMDTNPNDIAVQQEIGQKFIDNPDLDDAGRAKLASEIVWQRKGTLVEKVVEDKSEEKKVEDEKQSRNFFRRIGRNALFAVKLVQEVGFKNILHDSLKTGIEKTTAYPRFAIRNIGNRYRQIDIAEAKVKEKATARLASDVQKRATQIREHLAEDRRS